MYGDSNYMKVFGIMKNERDVFSYSNFMKVFGIMKKEIYI